MSERTATLTVDNKTSIELPIYEGTLGQDVIDIGALGKHDVFTFDPGFAATAACRSDITFIDGDKGILLHRGYPIEVLAKQSDYLEICYLLLEGDLPSSGQKIKFEETIKNHTMVNSSMEQFISGFRYDAHPMAMLCSLVAAMASFYHDSLDITNPEHRILSAHRLIAKMPTIAAMCHKHFIGQPFIYPENSLSYSENFLNMMFATPCEDYPVHPAVSRAMDRILLLHADHEQNASTSTVRLTGSSGANPFACISAGIAALWGPAHGGANEAVLSMLYEIGHEDHISEYIKKAKDKDDPFRLMGFGHRVYKNHDPRATVMRESCDEVLTVLGLENDPLFRLAKKLEKIALEDEYFIEKKLYPNVDFYSGIILKALGIPTEMFTVIFATGRTVGWISHWNEMITNPYRIGRPRQLYTGADIRDFQPIKNR